MDLHLKRLCLLLLIGPLTGLAQEEIPEVAIATETEAQAAEIEEMSPGLSSDDLAATVNESEAEQVLVSDVRRSESGGSVMDRMDLGRTEITGNQELPKVMYIVPWQKSDPGELMGRPVNTLLDEVLAPIDRSEFMRQVDYYDDLYTKDEE
jgi:hypothetical protein